MYEFARRGNALAMYDGLYRHLSHFASHPSLSSVDSYIVTTAEGHPRAMLIPLIDYTSRTVLSDSAGVLVSCIACGKVGVGSLEMSASANQLWIEFERL
jgi:hypothetical protein